MKLIQSLIAREQSDLLYSFSELLFDRIGLEQEYLDEHLYLVKPTENLAPANYPDWMRTDYRHLPSPDGIEPRRSHVSHVGASHHQRDDGRCLAATSASDLGTFKHRGVPPAPFCWRACIAWSAGPCLSGNGSIFGSAAAAHAIDPERQGSGDKLSSSFLADALQSVPSRHQRHCTSQTASRHRSAAATLENRAESEIKQRRETALDKATQYYAEEVGRLTYLQSVNPSIRDEELTELRAAGENCQRALANTKPVLEGLRVCIAI